MNIYPAILTDQLHIAQSQLDACTDSGLVHTVQIDVIDGYFVDNVTITPADAVELEFADLEVDFHLMTQEPLDFVREIIEHEQELPVRSVIGQVERMSNQELFVDEVRRYSWNVGLSLDLHTPLSAIDSQVWDRLHIVQLMAIELGYQGQEFQESVFTKLRQLRQFMEEKDLRLEVIVDGGVTETTIAKLQEFGATSVGVGSYLWKANEFAQAFQTLETEIL